MCRGGGGGDSSWHRCGSGLEKQNSIQDFIFCANFLIDYGYVHKNRLGSIGYSAGGLLVGAAINMHPDLFGAAILKVSLSHTLAYSLVFTSCKVDRKCILKDHH